MAHMVSVEHGFYFTILLVVTRLYRIQISNNAYVKKGSIFLRLRITPMK